MNGYFSAPRSEVVVLSNDIHHNYEQINTDVQQGRQQNGYKEL